MRSIDESHVTTGPTGAAPLIIDEGAGAATMLVPGEDVRLLAVDLPLPSRAKRIEALPFAVEEAIAEPLESVHLALGTQLDPGRYLVGVVRHDRMQAWLAEAAAQGTPDAAFVADPLALPRPDQGEWAVELGETRALVRAGDGTGFAIPAQMIRAAWEAAGRPAIRNYGAALPEDMVALPAEMGESSLARRVVAPALDLRQGGYARRRQVALPGWGRRLFWVGAIGLVAHVGIATADTVMLRSIADKRQEEVRTLVATTAPGTPTNAEDLAGSIADMLPEPKRASAFLPLVSRVSAALAPLNAELAVRGIAFQGDALVIDMQPLQGDVTGRLRAAISDARLAGQVTEAPGGAIRMTVKGA